ncbi:Ig-like domain-containing protein [Siccibacter turicensis]|uniref:Ig-like domain-containing protein n=1 Tax=Siccibacter turicensis TaxID=357233 RepID=UPI002A6AA5B9|nr:Ig-like domain-containing protein [Siccibacter turicensis]MDY0970083.1 Ig-like domain-containing protein [Siccibacter turicensis]
MALQNSLSESVDILNKQSGDVITQYSQSADRVVNLAQSSVVRINASPEVVNFYERQGGDLIVHMKDGSTVRYQNFFRLDLDGQHSELIFEDSLGTHHAVFPFASEAAPATAEVIVPTYADTSLGALIGGEGLASASGISGLGILGGIAAAAGVAGIAIAASNSGGGDDNNDGGNTGGGNNGGGNNGGGDNGGGTPPNPPSPTLTIDPITPDNVINNTESLQAQTLSGLTNPDNAGSLVSFVLGGRTWTTTVGPNGEWSVTMPSAVIRSLPQGLNSIKILMVDSEGRTISKDYSFTVDTVPPALELAAFAPGNVLDSTQLNADKIVRGTSDAADVGSRVTITLNGKTYTTVVDKEGNWQSRIPLNDLKALADGGDYTVTYTVTDKAGNVTTGKIDFSVNLNQGAITVNPLTGDNALNGAETQLDQILSGQTQNIAAGQTVTITLGGKTYYAIVQGDGSWKTTVPAGDLLALSNGTQNLAVSVPDQKNNVITKNTPITVDQSETSIAIAIIATDDYLNATEVTQPLEVRGVSTVFGPGVSIVVQLNGKSYNAVIDGAGNWSAVIPVADLAQLKDGPREVTATVTLGSQTATDQHILNVAINQLPKPEIEPPFGDAVLNATEAGTAQVITGNTGVSGIGQKVSVVLGGKTYTGIVDSDGTWSVTVPAADLQKLPQGSAPLVVNVSDAAGNNASLPVTTTVDTLPPELAVLPMGGDGKLSGQDLTTAQVLSGISAMSEAGQTVTVTLNNKTYTTQVGSDGNWQIAIPSADLTKLPGGDNTVKVSLTDAAGNVREVQQTITVKTALPTVSVDNFTADNILDAAEVKTDQVLQGKTTNAEAGSVVTVTLNGNTWNGVVGSDGSWSITIPAAVLQQLNAGDATLQLSVTDALGQTRPGSHTVKVDTAASGVAISIIAGDDYLGRAEAGQPLTVNGTSAGLAEGTTVTVVINNVTYTAQVNAGGNWSVVIQPADLQNLPDGQVPIQASAPANGGTVTAEHTLNVILDNVPVVSNDPLFGDNTLNGSEILLNQVLTGTTGVTGPGQTVAVTLGGNTYNGVVDSNGNWSVTLPSGALDDYTNSDSPVPVTIVAKDAAGNQGQTVVNVIVDVTPPVVTINPFTGNDYLNLSEANTAQTLSGVASGAEIGSPVSVTINGQTLTGTVTGADGEWSISIPSATLKALPNGENTFNVTVTDTAGNSVTTPHTVNVSIDPQKQPLLTIDPVAGNNVIDAAERDGAVNITGTALNVSAGQTVTVTLGLESWTGVVGADGKWSVTIPQTSVAGLTTGSYSLQVGVSDAAGNTATATRPFTVDTTVSAISIAPLTGDDNVGVDDLTNGLVVNGGSTGLPDGTPITVTLNGKQYEGEVTNGSWSVTIPAADATAIADGTATLTVSARDGNGVAVSKSHDFTLITDTLPVATLNTPFTDGIVNSSEAQAGGTLSGSTGVNGAGQTVTVQIGTETLTATVDANGNWTVNVPSSVLSGLADGSTVPVVVTATDRVGNDNVLNSSLVIDKTPPAVTIDAIGGDDRIVNASEAANPLVISGTATPYNADSPEYVVVQVNGQTYNALVLPGGTWSVTLPAGALNGMPDGPASLTVIATDAAGNTSSTKGSFTLDASPANAPQITLNAVAGDNFVNAGEIADPLQIGGTVQNAEVGRPIVVELNGKTYNTTVQAGGLWSITVPVDDLAAMPDGVRQVKVTVTDVAGNTDDATRNITFITKPASLPTLSIDNVAVDNVINAAEKGAPLTITGISTNLPAGTLVSVFLNDKTYPATIGADGKWSITVPQGDVAGLNLSNYNVVATASDAAGNPANDVQPIVIDLTGPVVDVNTSTGFLQDGNISIGELASDQVLSGTTTPGSTVVLVINGKEIPALVNDQGEWSVTIPAADLQALPQGESDLTVRVTDPQGNITNEPVPVNVSGPDLPTITLGTVFGDGLINAIEAAEGGTLTGTSVGLAPGTVITLFIGTTPIGNATVGPNGDWTANIDSALLTQFPSGQYQIVAQATDAFGNPARGSVNTEILLEEPTATLPGTLFGDGYINQSDAATGQTLTGNTGVTGSGQTVVVNIPGQEPITGTVDADGNWTVLIPPAVLQDLPQGETTATVTVTDKAGNETTSPDATFIVRTEAPPEATLTQPFGNGYLNADEASAGGTIGGTTGLPAAQLGTVQVSINNGPLQNATINPDGSWSLDVPAGTLEALPDGTIPVKVIVTDVAGNTSTGGGSFETIVNDLPAPTVQPLFGDGVLNYDESQSPPVIRGSTGVTGEGQTVTVTLGGKDYSATVNPQTGEWTLALQPTDLSGLPVGTTQNVTVVATDAAGNSVTLTPAPSFVPQTERPTPTATDLFGGDEVLNISEAAGPLTITGTTGVTGPDQAVTITIDVDGVTYPATVAQDGTWTVQLPAGSLQNLDPSTSHSIIVRAEDQYGNSTETPIPFEVAFTAPTVAVTTPVFGNDTVNAAEAEAGTTLSGTFVSTRPEGSTVTVNIGGKNFTAVVDAQNGTWSLALSEADWAGVGRGAQTIVVTIEDGADNTGSTSVPVNVAVDVPTLTITTPLFGDGTVDFLESQQPQVINGTSTSLAPGQAITLIIGGRTAPGTAIVQADGSWSYTVSPAFMDGLTNGAITVQATVTDTAGNSGASAAIPVTVDIVPPEVSATIFSVADDNIINAAEFNSGNVTINGTSTGYNVGDVIQISINGTTLTGTATIGANGTWSLSVPASEFPTDGVYQVIATGKDGTESPVVNVTVDTTLPTVTIGTISGDDIINGTEASAPLVLSGTASTADVGRLVTVTLNGKTYTAAVTGDGSWTLTVPQGDVAALPSGNNVVTASLTDAAGNTSVLDSRTVDVDRDAPLLEVNTLSLPPVLNTVEAATGLLVQGRGEPGNTVTVRVGPLEWTSTVDSNGNWTHTFPTLDLGTLSDGPQVIAITTTDEAGNTATNSIGLNVALNKGLGVLVDDLFGGDGILNVAESLVTQTLTGQVSGDSRGATVRVTLAGTDINIPVGVVGPDGRFSIDLPPNLWQGLVGNTAQLNVNVTDANGNVTNKIVNVGLALTDLPVVGDVLVGVDNAINLVESGLNQTVTGVVSNAANVSTVVVTLAGRTFNATVDALGRWTAELPSTLLSTLPDGQIALGVNVTDKFGNVTSGGTNITVAANVQPSIILNPLFGDNILSIPELLNGVISGTATGLNGRTLTIKIGDTTAFTTNVDNTGKWSIALPEAVRSALEGLGSGNVGVTVTASDTYGNTASTGANVTLDLLRPVLNAVTLFGDGLLSAADALVTQTITGTVGNAPVGSTVNVNVGGKIFTGLVAANGTFSINVNPADLRGLADGTLATSVTLLTPDGNTSTTTGPSIKVGLTNLPTVAITSLFGGDGYLSQAEAGVAQTISGVSNLANGTVTLRIGTETLTGTITNGIWSVSVPSATLKGLTDGGVNVSVSVRDDVGNVGTGSQLVNAIINAVPQVTLATPFGDGNLSLSDLLSPQILSGTTSNLAAGTALTITLGGLTFNTTVAADGTWRLPLPTATLQSLQDGALTVGVTAKDVAGNVASATQNLAVAIQQVPTLVINSLFGDGGLSAADILSAQVISGTSTNAVGSLVNISLGGKTYQTTVGANGGWSVSVPKTDLSALLDGTLTVNASLTNPAGNPATTSGLVNVITHSLPTISLTSLFGNDGFLNVGEAGTTQTLSGRITGGVADGAKVVVTLGGTAYNATVNPDGTWTLPVASNVLQGLTNGALKVGVAVTDKVGNTNSTSADVTVKLTTPELSFNALASLNLLTLLSKGLTLSGGSRNLAPNSIVHLSLLNGTVNTTALTDANGNWSTTLGLGLDILQLLSLSSVLNIYATDTAGNTGYLNVGLNGQVISTTPPATMMAAAVAEDEIAFSLLASDETHKSTNTEESTSHTLAPTAAASTETDAAAAQTADDAYTIGGVSITLANGQQQSGDSVEGSTGSDTIHLSGLDFSHIDGGAGTDTLVLDGVNLTLDLIGLGSKIQHIEIVDLGKSGTNSITLDANGALAITDRPEDDLVIKGVDGDRVNLVHGNGDIWAVSGQRELDGVQFDVWHNSGQSNTLGDVLIQHGLHVNMV